ncbi:MAG: hypothetical protein QM813_13750 [Verrucomicrobiota bacterium]
MGVISKLNNLFRPARLSRRRMALALIVAALADGLQIPLQVPPFPEIIDVVAMGLTSLLLGFHLLLLPTFALEFFPIVDLVPTWTGCVLAVIALRRREEKLRPPVQSSPAVPPPVIAVAAPPPARGTKES